MHVLFFLLSLLHFGGALLLPNPSGPFSVALRIQPMTDQSRLDPYAMNKTQKRQVLASILWPVDAKSCSSKRVPYMPPATAHAYGLAAEEMGLSNDTFRAFEMSVCQITAPSSCRHDESRNAKFPVAVFSSGAGNSRLLYSGMARSLASYGYVVVLLDHPYDAEIVEFPDGTIITAANISDATEDLQKATQVRAQDISFVVRQLQMPSFQHKVFKGLPGKIDTNKIVALGHSMGGASAAAAMLLNPNIRGGVNMDGGLFDPVLSHGLDKPFMQLGRPNHRTQDTTWVEFWNSLRGPKVELQIADTVHGSYTDFPLLLKTLGLPKEALKQMEPLFGSVDGEELQKMISQTISAFWTYTFQGKKESLTKVIRESKGLSVVKSQLPE